MSFTTTNFVKLQPIKWNLTWWVLLIKILCNLPNLRETTACPHEIQKSTAWIQVLSSIHPRMGMQARPLSSSILKNRELWWKRMRLKLLQVFCKCITQRKISLSIYKRNLIFNPWNLLNWFRLNFRSKSLDQSPSN